MGPASDPDGWRELARRIAAGELPGSAAEDAIVDWITAHEVMPTDHPRLRVEIREQVRAVVRADRELARLLSQSPAQPLVPEPPSREKAAPRVPRAKKAAARRETARPRASATRSRPRPDEPDVESFAASQLRRRVFSIVGIGIVLAGGWVAWKALQEKPCDRLARKTCLALSDCELGAVRATLSARAVEDTRCEATVVAIDEALVGVDAAKAQGVFARVMTEQLGFDPRGESQSPSSKDGSKMRQATTVIENVGTITDLFADEAHLIWTSQSPAGVFRGRSIGGDVEALSDHAESIDVVATRDFIYWVSRAPSGGTLWTDKKRGEYEPMAIEVEGWSPTRAAFMGPELAFVDGTTGAIVMAAVAGGDPRPIAQGGLPAPVAIAADATHVFWATASGSIASAPRDGGETLVLAEGSGEPTALVLDTTHLYWIDRTRGTLVRVPKRGGAVEKLVADRPGLSDLAIDETHVYATDGAGGMILSIAKADGAMTVLAEGLRRPTRIAVDRAALYWEAGGVIARLPK